MYNFFPFNTGVAQSDWIQEIPEYCFEHRSTEVYKSNRYDKPVYIFENHAAAIKAWYEQRKGAPELITFDEHTDTLPPLLRYKNNKLDRSESALISLLNTVKGNIDELKPDDFFRKGPILSKAESSISDKLWYDEQISTAIYLGIISKAYICSPRSDNPRSEIKCKELRAIYDNIIYLDDLIASNICSINRNEIDSCANRLASLYGQGLYNRLLNKLQKYAFPHAQDYILDIDLDFFSYAFHENMHWTNYTTFFQLIRRARAITIATEIECVKEACQNFNNAIKSYNDEAENLGLTTYPHQYWTAHSSLNGILSLIDFELSGKREQAEAKQKSATISQSFAWRQND